MSILKDLDPHYEKANGDDAGQWGWKAILLTAAVSSMALTVWMATQVQPNAKPQASVALPDNIVPAPAATKRGSDLPAAAAASDHKGAVIEEGRPSNASNPAPPAEHTPPAAPATTVTHATTSRTVSQETPEKPPGERKAREKSAISTASHKSDKTQVSSNKDLADRDVAIIRSLVK